MKIPPESVIGVRARWQCCVCLAVANTLQLAALGALGRVKLSPPRGWRIHRCRTYCGDHERAPQVAGVLREAA